jgi:hypothetical protein
MQPEKALALLTAAQDVVINSYSTANLPTISSMQLAGGDTKEGTTTTECWVDLE